MGTNRTVQLARRESQVYYPTFTPKFDKETKLKTRKTTAKGAGRVGSALAGMRRGTTVDNQIRQLVRGERIRAKHAFTKHIERFLSKFGWTPIDVQVPVWSTAHRLRTEVDLLCKDGRGNPVVCELKCGFEGYYHGVSSRMRYELARFGDSPMVQHQAQLAVTVELFRHTYGVRPRAYVLLINGATQRAYELRAGVAALSERIVRRIGAWEANAV